MILGLFYDVRVPRGRYLIPPLLNGNVPRLRAIGWLVLSWVANFAGAGFVAYFIAYQVGGKTWFYIEFDRRIFIFMHQS